MKKRIVTITTIDKFFKDYDCEYVSERPEKTENQSFIYDLKENKEGEVKYIVRKAYTGRVGSVITNKQIDFSKEKTKLILSEIIFWEQIPNAEEEARCDVFEKEN